jgi:pimeloyl-ACP methyl ester carboxylesterase
MANIILVHGGCHGGWCWDRVVPLLEARGYTVSAPDLPGTAGDGHPLRDVTLADRTRFIGDLVARQSEPVILVGHSMGGAVVSCAAECMPDRIGAAVYLAAFLLKDGENMWAAAGRIPKPPPDLIISEDGKVNRIGDTSLKELFYNTTPPEWRERALQRVTEESLAVASTPIQVTEARFGSVPRFYIETLRDKAIVPPLQRLMQADWPCERVLQLDCDHSAFYSMPEALAAHLHDIASEH